MKILCLHLIGEYGNPSLGLHINYHQIDVKRVFATLLINCWSFVAILLEDIDLVLCMVSKKQFTYISTFPCPKSHIYQL